MANLFSVSKSERTPLRRLSLLPRFGITVDVAGRQITYKHAPLLETLVNLRGRGFTVKNLLKVASEQLAEISFPKKSSVKAAMAVVKSSERAGATKKAAPKAAAKKKAAPTEPVQP